MNGHSKGQTELQEETNLILTLQVRNTELEALRSELSDLKRRRSLNLPILIPLLVATIGATASIVSVAVSQYYQAELAADAAQEEDKRQREAAQAALERELLSITLEADPVRADSNLRFLAISGMIPSFRDSVLNALDRGYSFSVAHGRGGPGFFPDPRIEVTKGQLEEIWGNYTGSSIVAPFRDMESHGIRNAEQYCTEQGFSTTIGFDVNCAGEDESAYVAYIDGVWTFIESGSANDYCFPLIEWIQCR
jgi:hypothetical protein